MGLVTEIDDDAAPTVLIVDNNPMSSLRLSNLFKTRNFNVEVCEDGDQAVDEYIRLDGTCRAFTGHSLSDGHLAALEMREHGGESRIVFVAPTRMADLARNATFSAGARLGCKPISGRARVGLGHHSRADSRSARFGRPMSCTPTESKSKRTPARWPSPSLPALGDYRLLANCPWSFRLNRYGQAKERQKTPPLLVVIGLVAGAAGYGYQGMLPVTAAAIHQLHRSNYPIC